MSLQVSSHQGISQSSSTVRKVLSPRFGWSSRDAPHVAQASDLSFWTWTLASRPGLPGPARPVALPTGIPLISTKSDKPSLMISTLEASSVAIGLKLFFGDRLQPHRTKIPVMPTWTDNRGKGAALNKLLSTRFPASAVLMELPCRPQRMSIEALVEGAPREVKPGSRRARQRRPPSVRSITTHICRARFGYGGIPSMRLWAMSEAAERKIRTLVLGEQRHDVLRVQSLLLGQRRLKALEGVTVMVG